jgi:hypothetical protein
MRLIRPWRNMLLTVHIATAAGAIGADLGLLAMGMAVLSGTDPAAIYPAAHLVASSVMAPLAIAAVVTGLWLGLGTSWGVLRYWWTAIKLVISVALATALILVLIPSLAASADAALSGTAFADARRVLLAVTPIVATSLLLVNVVLAVFKPGWRLRGLVAADAAESRQ